MKKFLLIVSIITIFSSCKNDVKEVDVESESIPEKTSLEIKNDNYELHTPTNNIRATLILFGGYPESVEDIKREFKILETAIDHNISVLLMNYNKKLWLGKNELEGLAEQFQNIFETHKLPTDNVYVGGFSSGGNMALLISDFMTRENTNLIPKGVFIVDSPIDLAALYNTAQKNIERDSLNATIAESTWLLETLSKEFGNPNKNISNYEAFSVYTAKTSNIDNIEHLKNTKIRLYTEPDSLWWKEKTMAKYDEMNAYYIKSLYESLNTSEFSNVEYIPTKNKGYRSDGERNPHSWSIIDKENLINWMLNEK